MNNTPDIYEYASFSWFQWLWFFDETPKTNQLCRWLGPTHGVGQGFCFYILTNNGGFITRSSLIPIYGHAITTNHMTKRCNNLMERMEAKIGNVKQTIFMVWTQTEYIKVILDITTMLMKTCYFMEKISNPRKRSKLTRLTSKR